MVLQHSSSCGDPFCLTQNSTSDTAVVNLAVQDVCGYHSYESEESTVYDSDDSVNQRGMDARSDHTTTHGFGYLLVTDGNSIHSLLYYCTFVLFNIIRKQKYNSSSTSGSWFCPLPCHHAWGELSHITRLSHTSITEAIQFRRRTVPFLLLRVFLCLSWGFLVQITPMT